MLTLKYSLFKYKNSHTSSDWEPSVPLSSITPPKRKQRRTFYLWVMFFLLPRASSGNWRNSQFFLPKTMRYLAQAGFHSFGVLPSRISWLPLSPPTFTCWLEQCFCLFCGRGFFFLYCAEKASTSVLLQLCALPAELQGLGVKDLQSSASLNMFFTLCSLVWDFYLERLWGVFLCFVSLCVVCVCFH